MATSSRPTKAPAKTPARKPQNRAQRRQAERAGPHRIDLDAAAAARREARGEHLEVVLGGQTFTLPPELPLDAIEPLAALAELEGADEVDEQTDNAEQFAKLRTVREALTQSLAALFCTEELTAPRDEDDLVSARSGDHEEECQWRVFAALRPSLDSQSLLLEQAFTWYGVTLGEALARIGQSRPDGAPSS